MLLFWLFPISLTLIFVGPRAWVPMISTREIFAIFAIQYYRGSDGGDDGDDGDWLASD